MNIKCHLYEEAGVIEYWIVSLEYKQISVYVLESKLYVHKGDFRENDIVPVCIWDGQMIKVKDIFEDI